MRDHIWHNCLNIALNNASVSLFPLSLLSFNTITLKTCLIYVYAHSGVQQGLSCGQIMAHTVLVKKKILTMPFYQVRLRLEEFHLDEFNARSSKSSRIRCYLRKCKLISNRFNLYAILINQRMEAISGLLSSLKTRKNRLSFNEKSCVSIRKSSRKGCCVYCFQTRLILVFFRVEFCA